MKFNSIGNIIFIMNVNQAQKISWIRLVCHTPLDPVLSLNIV